MSGERRTQVRTWHGAAAVVLSAGAMEATFIPELGMLGTSLRHDGDDLVAMPHGLGGYRAGRQTGIPLLAPWANRLDGHRYEFDGTAVDLTGLDVGTDPNGLPMHGTMTAQPGWEISMVTAGSLRATFRYGDHPDLMAAFPFAHDLVVEASLSEEALTVTTTVRATGAGDVPVAFGWHPYLKLPRSPRRAWRLVLPACDHLELDERSLPTGRSTVQPAEREPIGDRTFDDLYALHTERVLVVEDRHRRLAVHFDDGYPYAQVYAPRGAGFVCLEPMTAPTSALSRGGCPRVAPGEEVGMRYAIVHTQLS